MKSVFGQYAKVIILVLVLIPLFVFVFDGGFISKMPKDEHLEENVTGKEDSDELVSDIAARKKPVISITTKKLKNGENVKFLDFGAVSFADDSAADQKFFVKSIVRPDGTVLEGAAVPETIRVPRGIFKVTYRAEETYKGTLKYAEKTAQFIVDKNDWTPSTYTVKYEGNGATTGLTPSSNHVVDTFKKLSANGFTKTGYRFAGWAESPTGPVVYSDQQSVKNLSTTGATKTLYAKWTPITYTVKYNGNGAKEGATANSVHTYDQEKTLTVNGYVREGYQFMGWAESTTGDVLYSNGQSVKNLSARNGSTVTLYARWKAK